MMEMLRPPQNKMCGAVGERAMPWIRSREKIRRVFGVGFWEEGFRILTNEPSPAKRRRPAFGEGWNARDVMGEVFAIC